MFFKSFKGSIFYEIYGKGFPILLLHGLGGSHESMFEIAKDLDGFSIIIPDLPNHGQSDDIDGDLDDIAKIFHDLMAYLKYEKYILIGLSLGSLIAQNMAYKYKNEVEKLILLSPGVVIDEVAMNVVMTWFNAEDGGASTTFSQEFYQKHKAEILKYNNEHPFEPSRLAGIASSLINFDIRDKKIDIPCLAIIGNQDIIFGPRIIEDLQKIYKSCNIKIINSGHAIHRESPKEVSKIIKEFLYQDIEL
ncbi:MAG: alpha/beta fold hydrolase [Thermoplasmata archaeon]